MEGRLKTLPPLQKQSVFLNRTMIVVSVLAISVFFFADSEFLMLFLKLSPLDLSISMKEQRKIRLKITKIKEDESQVEYIHDVDDERAESDKENDDDGDDLLKSHEKDKVETELEKVESVEEPPSECDSDNKGTEDVAVVDSKSLRSVLLVLCTCSDGRRTTLLPLFKKILKCKGCTGKHSLNWVKNLYNVAAGGAPNVNQFCRHGARWRGTAGRHTVPDLVSTACAAKPFFPVDPSSSTISNTPSDYSTSESDVFFYFGILISDSSHLLSK